MEQRLDLGEERGDIVSKGQPGLEITSFSPVVTKRTDGGASHSSSARQHPSRPNIRYTKRKYPNPERVVGKGIGKGGMKRLSQTLAMTQDELDEDYVPPRAIATQVNREATLGFPGRNVAHALAVATVNSVKKVRGKGKIVLTAAARERMAEVRAQKSQQRMVTKQVKPTKQAVKQGETTKRPHCFCLGTVALREIWCYQKSFKLILPFLPFAHLCREIGAECSTYGRDLRWSSSAILALQEASEAYCVGMLEDAQLSAINSRRITILAHDIWLVKCLRLSVYCGFDEWQFVEVPGFKQC